MAVYTTPSETHEHYVERDTSGSSAGVWAVIAVLLVLFAILFFGTNIFGRRGTTGTGSGGVNINGSVQTPGSTSGGTSSGGTSGSGSGSGATQ